MLIGLPLLETTTTAVTFFLVELNQNIDRKYQKMKKIDFDLPDLAKSATNKISCANLKGHLLEAAN